MKLRLVLAILILVVQTFAQNAKVSRDLWNAPGQNVDVIVQYHTLPAPGLLQTLLSIVGGVVKGTLGLVNAVLANVPVARLGDLAADPNVKYISLDRSLTPLLDNATPAVAGDIARGYGWTARAWASRSWIAASR